MDSHLTPLLRPRSCASSRDEDEESTYGFWGETARECNYGSGNAGMTSFPALMGKKGCKACKSGKSAFCCLWCRAAVVLMVVLGLFCIADAAASMLGFGTGVTERLVYGAAVRQHEVSGSHQVS